MLKQLELENFRCFSKAKISFRELTIIVGKNNAGKSTLIEVLRILAVVVKRRKNSLYVKAPFWVGIDEDILGIQPVIRNMDISQQNIFYMYGEGPAKIVATFHTGVKVSIYIGEELEIFATIQISDDSYVESKKWAQNIQLEDINILPQISPLLKVEPVIQFDTVIKNFNTNIESRNFRNQLNYFPTEFAKFKEMAEKTWQGLHIDSNSDSIRTKGNLFLFVRDNNFEAEIGWMGHGLQMWLQIMWFLSKCKSNSTVILDEPDVYMHADLQRRLMKLIKYHYKQVIIATHSIEIMSEVEAENILPINSKRVKQDYASSMPFVQKIVDDIGSVHNIEIARLFSYNKFLVVEGEKDDVKLLTIFQLKVFPETFEQFDILPKTFVEGWGGWQRVIGSSKVFKDNKTTTSVFCIFDSDYHLGEEINQRKSDAKTLGINLHVWSKKEIENYLLIPNAITRLINEKANKSVVNEADLVDKIESICEDLKEDLLDSVATEIMDRDRSQSLKTANQKARAIVLKNWDTAKWNMVSGKVVVTKLSKWVVDTYRVRINKFDIARSIIKAEIPSELIEVITHIEENTDFNN